MWHDVFAEVSKQRTESASPENDAALAASLATVWPHRWHESSWLKNMFCHAGVHNWKELYLDELLPEREVRFCSWCTKVKLDGTVYGE
jgi:hypothetical protein